MWFCAALNFSGTRNPASWGLNKSHSIKHLIGSICYKFMKTEFTAKSNGIWSPFSQMQWYRKRCDKLHKKFQDLRLQERLESFVEKLTESTTQKLIPDILTTAAPTRGSNLRLYWKDHKFSKSNDHDETRPYNFIYFFKYIFINYQLKYNLSM